MRILFLHNKYLISGGEDVSTQSEIDILKANGHFVDSVFVSNEKISDKNIVSVAVNTIWSKYYYYKTLKLIDENNYDIIHVQNFFPQISPSIFYAAKKRGIKIVMSVRNYRLICPNALLFVDNKICDRCVGKTAPYPSIIKKCYKENYLATSVVFSMLTIHNVLGTWAKYVDGFIAISSFVKNQLIRGGISENLIYVKHNFVNDFTKILVTPGNHFTYVGRLSTEKGIEFLLSAFEDNRLKDIHLKIIGEGPLAPLVLKSISKNNNISYLGKLSINETYKELASSKSLIFPSQWHEPFGRTIIESFSVGTPVLGSKVGGVTELIREGFNGFLFDPSNSEDFIEKLLILNNIKGDILRRQARESFVKHFTADISYNRIMEIYQGILKNE